MRIITFIYKKILKRHPPYYANYSVLTILWKPLRKYINVVIIPNIPFNSMRIILYRLIGYKIGKKVFIGMKCYMDDIDPKNTTIEDNVVISYGCYFACHGKGQGRTHIHIKRNAYIGMRCNFIAGKKGIIIGEMSLIGAGTLVNKNIPAKATALGVPAKIIRNK